ncbi:MAG: hypothetical protein WCY37_04250 [Candidatus Dojkabacteria bacterium]
MTKAKLSRLVNEMYLTKAKIEKLDAKYKAYYDKVIPLVQEFGFEKPSSSKRFGAKCLSYISNKAKCTLSLIPSLSRDNVIDFFRKFFKIKGTGSDTDDVERKVLTKMLEKGLWKETGEYVFTVNKPLTENKLSRLAKMGINVEPLRDFDADAIKDIVGDEAYSSLVTMSPILKISSKS